MAGTSAPCPPCPVPVANVDDTMMLEELVEDIYYPVASKTAWGKRSGKL